MKEKELSFFLYKKGHICIPIYYYDVISVVTIFQYGVDKRKLC